MSAPLLFEMSANSSVCLLSLGGGGNGGRQSPDAACSAGLANSGGGGGGEDPQQGCSGGSGVVIIRYQSATLTGAADLGWCGGSSGFRRSYVFPALSVCLVGNCPMLVATSMSVSSLDFNFVFFWLMVGLVCRCASGLAELSFRWDSVQIAGCSYVLTHLHSDFTASSSLFMSWSNLRFLYYSQYKCAERNVNLLAYWDYGACGPRGDDFDWGWCGGQEGNCPATVSVANSICNSGTANLAYKYDDVTIDGCSYIFYAQYVCTTNLGFLHAQLYDGMTSADWTRFDNSAPAAQWQFPAPLNVDVRTLRVGVVWRGTDALYALSARRITARACTRAISTTSAWPSRVLCLCLPPARTASISSTKFSRGACC
jgi:hypothetical protein